MSAKANDLLKIQEICAERDIALTKTWVEEATTPDETTGRASECSIDGKPL